MADIDGEIEMKRVLIFCEYCEHRIHFHDLFQHDGQAFFHALCWELSLLHGSTKMSVFGQGQLPHTGPQPLPRNRNSYL